MLTLTNCYNISISSDLAGPPPPSAAGSGGNGGYMMHQPTDVENDTIFISGMPLDVTEDQLSTHFGSIGIIKVG